MKQITHGLSACIAVATLAMAPLGAMAQSYPSKPITLVVPYAPGGSADIIARVLGEKMQKTLGQSIIVENRPGGGTIIGARSVAGAPADGYTLLIGTVSSNAMTPAVNASAGYDPVKDFSPIGRIASMPFAVLTRKGLGAQDLSALIALAKQQPDKLTYGSAGIGTSNHMAGELLKSQAGIDVRHVPYRGSAPAMNALLAGEVDVMFDLVATAIPHIKEGSVQALATTGAERSPFLPKLPTVAEEGTKGYEVSAWFGLFAPAGLPAEVGKKLNSALNAALTDDAIQERFKNLGITPEPTSTADFTQFVQTEASKWQKIVSAANIAVNK